MKMILPLLCALLLPLPLHANPFPKADLKAGKQAYDEAKCSACHNARMSGNGDLMYTRPERRVKSPEQLRKLVHFCVGQTGASVFPEDIEHIAAYLNHQFYKFK
jgi:mono/diheme cytochrome c family protein